MQLNLIIYNYEYNFSFTAISSSFVFRKVNAIPTNIRTIPTTCILVGLNPVKTVSNSIATAGSKNTNTEIILVDKSLKLSKISNIQIQYV